jgi:CheY-like chemotaxis protein
MNPESLVSRNALALHPAELWTQSGSKPPAQPGAEPESHGTHESQGRVPVVLLVEDNPINQVVAQEFLALMGLECRLAGNGIEALAQCRQAAPDLALMDIQMPGMDGLECARQIRALQRAGELAPFPILALTAHALDSDVKASLEAGMDEHLNKPLDFLALRQRLSRWLEMPGLND